MELKALHRLGWTVSALARHYGLSRITVRKELASQADRAQRGPADPHRTPAQCLPYEGSYPAFQRHLRLLRPAEVKDPEIRFETGPGIQTQADWAKLGLFPLGDQMVELSAMVAILGCSRAPAIRFAATRPDRPRSSGCSVAWATWAG